MAPRWASYQSYMYRYGLIFMCATAGLTVLMDEGSGKTQWNWMISEQEKRQAAKKRME